MIGARHSSDELGRFQVIATTPKGKSTNLSRFRDAPVQLTEMSTRDPFGDAALSITFPNITIFDRPGQGDLSWLLPYTSIDVRFIPVSKSRPDVPDSEKTNTEILVDFMEGETDNPIPGLEPPIFYQIGGYQFNPDVEENIYRYPLTKWKWEGFIASYDINNQGLTISCKGALYQLDNYLAKPEFPHVPIPYELLLKRSFNPGTHPGLVTNPLHVVFPENWQKQVLLSASFKPGYLQPFGIAPGDDWTGLTSRSTGAWDPTLTGFIQGLLSVMFTDDGRQWTIYKLPGRQPLLKLRREPGDEFGSTLTVNAENPGVELALTRDFSQSVNSVYGSGKDLAGVAFSGQKITPDGRGTYYVPFAHAPQVYPPSKHNKNYDPFVVVPKEGLLEFPQGLNELDGREVAAQQYRRFADPGFTGTITLTADPKFRGFAYPRYFIQAGMSIAVKNMLGYDSIIFHVVECSINVEEGSATLSVDTKFRDYLTWQEIRARTRDALIPLRSLQVGQYSNILQDLLKPWSYRDGSGVMPSNNHGYDATGFFNNILPKSARFPYEEFTRKNPPKNPDTRHFYMKVPARNPNDADENWGLDATPKAIGTAFPIKASQAANIRLTQLAAYDKDGNVKKVPFHFSIYKNVGTNVLAMPKIPGDVNVPFNYKAGQHYPFFRGAWESVTPQGGEVPPFVFTAPGSGMQIGWGNFFEPAGYWPGLKSAKGKPTGLMVDETSWSYDCTDQTGWDRYDKKNNVNNPNVGVLYLMLYCDADPDEPTYFMGRFFREEPGSQ